jgi:PEP-CTERM motif
MKGRLIAAGALATFMANGANATVYFNSATVGDPVAGADGSSDGNTYEAASFTAAATNFNQLTLVLSDVTPSDTGSVLIYLVPDNGSGGSNGISGAPVTTAPAGNELIGTISDSRLSSIPSPVTLYYLPSGASLATSDKEYWIEVRDTGSSAAAWEYGTGGAFLGSAGQSNMDSVFPTSTSDSAGTYDMTVAAPEPASLGILGAGLFGLGYIRRRNARRV